MPLPFLQIPKLCQLDIIEKLDFPELVRLSTCSQKAVELIQQSTVPGRIMLGNVQVENGEVLLWFSVDSDERKYRTGINQQSMSDARKQIEWNGLDGLQFSERLFKRRNFPDWHCEVSSLNSLARADKFISHLRNLIRNFIPKTLTVVPTTWMSKRLIEEYFPKIGELIINSEDGGKLASEHMKWAMNTVEVTDHLLIRCEIPITRNKYKYTEGFKTKKVTITNPHWVHLNAIIDSRTEIFKFLCLPPTSQFFKTILKAWITNEKLQNLKELSLETLSPRFKERFQNQVMEGIEQTELTPEEQQRFEEDEESEFVRFIRRIDGKVGVAMVQQGQRLFEVSCSLN